MKLIFSLIFFTFFSGCTSENKLPEYLFGNFEDDYEIQYSVSDSLFFMKPDTKFHILSWNTDEQYFIAENDTANEFDGGLYSRIDWMKFENMLPYEWGFCLTAYKAPSPDSAKSTKAADRLNPKTGCNEFPFSRMKPIKS